MEMFEYFFTFYGRYIAEIFGFAFFEAVFYIALIRFIEKPAKHQPKLYHRSMS